jgi:uncharacterized membrane protein
MTTSTTTTTSYGYPARATLPIGVAVLAILIGLFGLLLVVAGILGLFVSPFLGFGFHGLGFFGWIILLILGIILLAVASGLWHLELWALALAILVLLVLVVWNGYDLLTGGSVSLIDLIVEVILLIYLIAVSNHFA